MKTIEISDELYEKLEKVSKEMNTQNHLCTAMPYIWTIREEEKDYWVEQWYSDWYQWFDDENEECPIWSESDDSDYEDYLESQWILDNWKKSKMDYEDYLEEMWYWKNYWRESETFKNWFLTRKWCEEHIKENNYHYSEPTPYLLHLWRNEEMKAVQQFLCELTWGKLHT